MRFNSDPLKQEQEMIFSRKRNKPYHPDTVLNGNPVKHLGMFIDSKVDFDEHIKGIKLINPLLLFASSEIFNRDHLFYKSLNLLLDLTSITVILYMRKIL